MQATTNTIQQQPHTETAPIIKFKSTNTTHQVFELPFLQNKTIGQYKDELSIKTMFQTYQIKCIFKGKVLIDKQKVGDLKLSNGTVMMVLLKSKKQKKELTSDQQKIHVPAGNLSTGLGSSSPVGFGGYGIVNHPQYMSAISGAVDQQKVQEMMEDPYYQQMMQQMLQDPDTLKQLIQQNPMMKSMMQGNPMMKMMMENPAMLKMMFNKDTMKMVSQMKKNGTLPNSANMSNMGNMGTMGMGSNNPQSTNANNPMATMFGQGNQMMNPNMYGYGGMGGFGGMNGMGGFGGMNNMNMNGLNYGNLFNPMMNQQNGQSQNNGSSSQSNSNPLQQMFSNLSLNNNNSTATVSEQQKYKGQLKQLSEMGFKNKQNCLRVLKQVNGDIDRALQKLCSQDV